VPREEKNLGDLHAARRAWVTPGPDRRVTLEMLAFLRPFSSRVSHALRNPLSGILMNAQMLSEELPESSPLQAYLLDLLEGAKTMEDTLQLLLEFTSPSPPHPRTFPLPEAVAEVVRWIQQSSAAPSVMVRVSYGPQLNAVRADPHHVRKIIYHLLENATDAMPDGGDILIRCVNCLRTGTPGLEAPGLELSFSDKGPGIPDAHLHRVFDPFFTTRPRKIGLGLNIVSSLCELNHGTVMLASPKGQGTEVRVRLPAAALPSDGEAQLPAGMEDGDDPSKDPSWNC